MPLISLSQARLAYVPQEPELAGDRNVFEAVVAGMGAATRLIAEWHAVSHRLAEPGADHDALLEQLNRLQHELEALGAWSAASQAERAIERVGLDAEARVDTLSGGQKKRLALARALASEPQVLLLDEPTNHLDLGAIEWLEELLLGSGMSLLFITHDRRFLERLATRIIELDRGILSSFPGSFATYQTRKAEMLRDEAIQNARFDKFLAQEEVWIRKGVEARRTRNEGRVLRLEALRRERAARRDRLGSAKLLLDAGEKSGQLVAELTNVNKAFGDKTVVRDFSARIMRGDRIGLIGPNGAGKTTLLRLILGELAPDSGTVRLGTRLQAAYFDQFRASLDPEATLADIISPGSDYVEINGERKHVIGYLGDFLFAPARARSPVKSLSGGERNRLLLARLFARPANVLVLDEPTNDLDIETLELLEDLLQGYPGTIFLVSHDRTFLDNVVTQTIAAEGKGIWKEYAGGYEDWLRCRKDAAVAQRAAPARVAAKVRDEGVLVIGSGSITHNLRAFFTTRPAIGAPAPAWVSDFTAWVAGRMEANAIDDVLHAVERAPHGKDNHPTPDHILPLFVAMGAGAHGDNLHAKRLHASTTHAFLAMDVYAFGEESVAV